MDLDKIRNNMKEEMTTAMHAELEISSEVEIRLRVGCVWEFGFNATEQEIRKRAKCYSVSYEDCIKYKEFWRKLMQGR